MPRDRFSNFSKEMGRVVKHERSNYFERNTQKFVAIMFLYHIGVGTG